MTRRLYISFILIFFIIVGLSDLHSQANAIYVQEFVVPPNKISFDATKFIKDRLVAADIPLVDTDLGFNQIDEGSGIHKFTMSARFTESNLLSTYGYLIIEVIDQSQTTCWRYTDPIKSRAKFKMSKKGSARTQDLLYDLLQEFIVDYNSWIKSGLGMRKDGKKRYTSRDDATKTYSNEKTVKGGIERKVGLHIAVVEDSLYLHDGKWIPIKDVPPGVLEKRQDQQSTIPKTSYTPQSTYWTPAAIDEHYTTNTLLPLEGKYNRIDNSHKQIAIVHDGEHYAIITTQSTLQNWGPGTLKGTFISYEILNPFKITWVTELGETIETTALINNSNVLTINSGNDTSIDFRKVKE